jgi:hypothetical protein
LAVFLYAVVGQMKPRTRIEGSALARKRVAADRARMMPRSMFATCERRRWALSCEGRWWCLVITRIMSGMPERWGFFTLIIRFEPVDHKITCSTRMTVSRTVCLLRTRFIAESLSHL